MKIERMTIGDYDQVHELWLKTPGMGLNNLDDSRAGIEKYLKRNPETCFVARAEGCVIGVILCGHDGRRGNIHHTAAAAEFRKQGIGRKLVEAAIEGLRGEGITKVSFVVFRRNEQGNAFWKHLGFNERDDLIVRDMVISDEEMIRIDT